MMTHNMRVRRWFALLLAAWLVFAATGASAAKSRTKAKNAGLRMAGHADSTWTGVVPERDEGMAIPRLYQADYLQTVCTYNGVPKSVGTSGCGAVSVSMVIAYLTGNTAQNPYLVFYSLARSGLYQGSGLNAAALSAAAKNYGVYSKWVDCNEETIISALCAGYPVIMHMGTGEFTSGGHYIVLRGVTGEGLILVNDPASPERSGQEYELSLILEEAKEDAPCMICWAQDMPRYSRPIPSTLVKTQVAAKNEPIAPVDPAAAGARVTPAPANPMK